MHYPAVSKADEMIDGQAHSQIIIGNDGRHTIPRLGSIDQNNRKTTLDAEAGAAEVATAGPLAGDPAPLA